jgi:hypothetical protein
MALCVWCNVSVASAVCDIPKSTTSQWWERVTVVVASFQPWKRVYHVLPGYPL